MDEIVMAIAEYCKEMALEWSTKEKIKFDHYLHEHPLNFYDAYLLLKEFLNCSGCGEGLSEGSGFTYRCVKCDFDMHVECTQRPIIQSQGDEEELIQHFTHWHPLKLVPFNNHLEDCNFFVHHSCMIDIPRQINHFFHRSCPLVLLTKIPYQYEGCDEASSGLAFHCGKCKFQLDVKCALLSTVESKDTDKIQHPAHDHPLALHESKEFGTKVRCRGRKYIIPFIPYTLSLYSVTYLTSVRERDLSSLSSPTRFHPLITLPLSHHETFQCSSCLGLDDWFLLRYRYAKCDFELYIDCSKPKVTIPDFKYEGHIHYLSYFDNTLAPVECNICHEDAQTGFFRCVACAFNIHIYCIRSTSKTIKHERHLHPLTVTKLPFQYEMISAEHENGSNDEFYCDICEKRRYKFESVYYCPECKFIVELLPSLTILEEQSTEKGTVDSKNEGSSAIEATIENLNDQIAKPKQKRKSLKNEVEKHREILKGFEEELEQKN
ncbi:hypothetical protein Goklo_014500 [Gossypium klotzschianum]|uniref:DC1 domain-containing protein n=1 Tax=Gossypium klotzschianum TaxID=34286 RepID=A0A7J8U834_9ROSI|nr:hypothetical protein [Gossypium klotzschianum]